MIGGANVGNANGRVYLAAVGDVNNPRTWSGIPYHLLQAGRRASVIDAGLPLRADGPRWMLRRIAWNAAQLALRADQPGGYQYSTTFLESLWGPFRHMARGSLLVNCFQLFPPSFVRDPAVRKWHYLDMTLAQLFSEYGISESVGRRIREEALRREREGYAAAEGVICHSAWTARNVVETYGINEDKVFVVVPGASIDQEKYEAWLREAAPNPYDGRRPLRLAFVGKYWRRKGLDRLLRAVNAARVQGAAVALRVLGCTRDELPTELRRTENVEWVGFVDKAREQQRFIQLIAQCDIGCHLSRAEAGGIAQREFHALGLAVLGTNVGGAREHRFEEASIEVPVDATDEEVSRVLVELSRAPDTVESMKKAAWKRKQEALWAFSVRRLGAILQQRT